jgi:hypothetical protein
VDAPFKDTSTIDNAEEETYAVTWRTADSTRCPSERVEPWNLVHPFYG